MDPLNGDSADGGGEAVGGTGEDQIGSAAFSGSLKRSRSSLDYKGDPSSDKIIPQDARNKIFDVARAKGGQQQSGGGEELNQFAGMSSEEIIRHLYENPELAKSLGIDPAVVSAAATAGTSKKSSYRMQLLQKQGVPFVQWAIILLAVGFALYKVFKLLKPQTVTAKQKVKRKGGKKIAEKTPLREDMVLNKVVAEIEGAGDESKGDSGKGATRKPIKKKQPKKSKTKQTQSGTSKSKDDVNDSDSSEAGDAPSPSKSKQKKVTLVEEPVVIVPDEDSSGWQTVGSRAAAVAATGTNGAANKTPAMKPPNGSITPSSEDTAVDQSRQERKKNKSKKKKPGNGKAAPEATDPKPTNAGPLHEAKSAVEEDEALALRLQAEENRFAVESSEEDVWAEVTSRKKKNKS
jgi:hypothetical protein